MARTTGVAWAAGAFLVALCTWFIVGGGSQSTLRIAGNVACLGFAVFAAVCVLLAAHRATGRQRLAWGFIGIGLVGWVIGTAIWMACELVFEIPPFPSVADAGYVVFPIATCVGLALLTGGRHGPSRSRLALDGLITATALLQIAWVVVLHGVYDAGGSDRVALGLSLFYPTGDVVVITMAVLVLTRVRQGRRRALVLLTVGVVLMALSDSAFVYLSAHDAYHGGTMADVGWLTGLFVIGTAGLSAMHEPATSMPSVQGATRSALWLPYVPVAFAAVVCAPSNLRQPGTAALFGSTVVLVAAVLLRQFFVVQENRRLLAAVADRAMRDPLTGLANRTLFNDRLAHAMALHQRDGQGLAVLSLDLDDFKLVNDNLGHHAGDTLLVLVGRRIQGCVRTGDTVVRLGGDEFAVLMEGRAEQSKIVAHLVMAAFDEPFPVDGHDLLLRPSIGLALTNDETETTGDVLLKQADVAMYSAKRSRTGGVRTYDAEMHLAELPEPSLATTALGGAAGNGAGTVRLLGQLRRAIDHGELSLVHQPKFRLRDGALVGVESLVRWPHPERGMLKPDQFLPLVREHGLMRSVTDLVVSLALDDVARWHAEGLRVPIAVNVFAPSLCELALPDRILRSLHDRGLNPDLLTIEITEDLLLGNLDRTRAVLERLRAHRIRVAIDDFGSGYSTLGYLCELPIDEVKLDRQFIAPVLVDARAAAVVRAVVDLAHVLRLTTVAEGVENKATGTILLDYGCDVAQGFHYSPPLTAAELRDQYLSSSAPASARSS
jgi:diguanylate cyclase